MDPWVNSLVQSPLVRSLNTVPSRMSSFAHGVKDNVPPFSSSRVVIHPPASSKVASWSVNATAPTATSSVTETVRFDIPQYGLLDRAYILLRAFQSAPSSNQRTALNPLASVSDITVAANYGGANVFPISSSLNFADAIVSVGLSGNSKPIEVLYPASIASEVTKMPASQRAFFERSLVGYAADDSNRTVMKFSELWDPQQSLLYIATAAVSQSVSTSAVSVADRRQDSHGYVDFLIPLPFSTLKQLKDNYQTRFVEPLHIAVQLKGIPNFHGLQVASPTRYDGYAMSLVTTFHNFHDVIENSIRDQNYKRGFPASVYGYNFNKHFSPLTPSGAVSTINLTGKELVDEILVLIKRKSPSATPASLSYSPIAIDAGYKVNLHFLLRGSGREIWSGYDFELRGPLGADFELADGHPYGEDLADRTLQVTPAPQGFAMLKTGQVDQVILRSSVALGFHALYCMKLGMQSNANFYTGGIALQTISNPQLVITASGSGSTTFWDHYEADVTLRHSQMLRIDSDTGIITTSLTS